MTRAARLKAALNPYRGPALRELAERAGTDFIAAQRAIKGRPLSVSNYLKLCAAAGIHPMLDNVSAKRAAVGDFHRTSFGCAVRMWRIATKEGLRPAAKRMGIKHSTLQRIEHGEAVSVSATILTCLHIGRNPYEFTANVSRETSTATARLEHTRELAR